MLVEDQQNLLAVLADALTGAGFTVRQARFGDEALQICARHDGPIQLMIVDLFLPKASVHDETRAWTNLPIHGLELARLARVARPNIRVLFMSGHSTEDIRSLGGLPPGAQFLPKPFSTHTLIKKVQEILDTPGPQ